MLKVNDINVYYGSIHAIKGVSFEVNKGEIVTLIGANGAGKSTILNTVSGLLKSKTGSISFNDKTISGVLPHKIVAQGIAQYVDAIKLLEEAKRIEKSGTTEAENE